VVEQHHVDGLLGEQLHGVPNAGTLLDTQIRIGGERLGHALAEKRMVVDQQDAEGLLRWFGHWRHPST
jgi:hypothetical protein